MGETWDEASYRCENLKRKTVVTEDWKRFHEPCGGIESVVEEPQPPSYTIVTLRCRCGMEHLTLGAREVLDQQTDNLQGE